MKEKENNKNGKTATILATIAIIIALLVACTGTYLYYSGKLKGEQGQSIKGDSGYTPIKNIDYFDGKTPVKGIDYFDGKDGRSITGPAGRAGSDGRDGRDVPVNIPPVINLINISGYHNCYTFDLEFSVFDPDDENITITVYYGVCEDNWKELQVFFGGSGNYSVHKVIDYPTIYFHVLVWDGQDIGQETYTYTVDC